MPESGPSTADVGLYQALLVEMGRRLDRAQSILAKAADLDEIEQAALQLRFVLETLVLSSLVTNRPALEAVDAALQKKDADAARKLVRRHNPAYWPRPVTRVQLGKETFGLEDVEDGYLREAEWGRAFGTTSELLHQANPFLPPRDAAEAGNALRNLLDRILVLLRQHVLTLSDQHQIIGYIDLDKREAQATGWINVL